MPATNSIKTYRENGYYHLYNRGVEKRTIFLDDHDYKVFLHFLKRYLEPPPNDLIHPLQVRPPWRSDLHKELKLLAFCLMPNHFHLLVRQATAKTIAEFMRCLGNAYVRYFNERYTRVGCLFQGRYKGILVESKNNLLHLSRYIHLNPAESDLTRSDLPAGQTPSWLEQLQKYPYSSYKDYLGERHTSWVYPQEVLSYFKSIDESDLKNAALYRNFMKNYQKGPAEELSRLILETET